MSTMTEVSYGPNGEVFLRLRKVQDTPRPKAPSGPPEQGRTVIIIDPNQDDLDEFVIENNVIIYEM